MGLAILAMFRPDLYFKLRLEEKDRERRDAEALLENPKPWSPDMPFELDLGIDGDSYQRWVNSRMLFPNVVPSLLGDDFRAYGSFKYRHRQLPRGEFLRTFCGRRLGRVCFSTPVSVPVLDEGGRTWMSLTPAEVFSLRAGTKLARGRVIIGGLGLGHQLIEVTHKRSVREVVVVEKERALLTWLWPRIQEHCGKAPVEVVEGAAEKVIPTMEADVALVDIEPSYGYNTFPRCPNVGRLWVWGSSPTGKRSLWDD